ncbi:MAG: hypothetical protein V3S24_13360 [Candidatus Tectomicrobia bacterium]
MHLEQDADAVRIGGYDEASVTLDPSPSPPSRSGHRRGALENTKAFQGLRVRGAGAKMPFEILILDPLVF